MDARAPQIDELARSTRAVRRLAGELAGDASEADDLAQEACLAALRNQGRIRGPLMPWLAGTLRRIQLRAGRGRARRSARESAAAKHEPSPPTDELVARAELGERLLSELRALPDPYRLTLLFRYLDELPLTEVARRTQVPASTVRTRVQRGLALLRSRLDKGGTGFTALLPMLRAFSATKPPAMAGTLPLLLMTLLSRVLICAAILIAASLLVRFMTPPAAVSEAAIAPRTIELAELPSGSLPRIPASGKLAGLWGAPSPDPTRVPLAATEEEPTWKFAVLGRVLDTDHRRIEGARVWMSGPNGARFDDVSGV